MGHIIVKPELQTDVSPRLAAAGEGILRLGAAALQVLATLAVVRALDPTLAGLYFKGFVVACGISALLRNKYELYVAHYIVGKRALEVGVPVPSLLLQVAKRVLIRGAVGCAFWLVVTTDLDLLEPRLHPFLQTFLPFVLALPFTSLSLLLGAALRAANRTLQSVVVSAYAVNLAILAAAQTIASPTLMALSWAFFAGSICAAALASLLAWKTFTSAPQPHRPGTVTDDQKDGWKDGWKQVYAGVDNNALTGLALGGLLWGPPCLLALFAPAAQMAEFAVAIRSAQIVDFLLPAMVFVAYEDPLMMSRRNDNCSAARALRRNLIFAVAASSVLIALLFVATPKLLGLYGPPYTGIAASFMLLLGVQWLNASGRPSVRAVINDWQASTVRRILAISSLSAIVVAGVGLSVFASSQAALLTAAATVVGALIINGLSTRQAFNDVKLTDQR